MKQMCKKKYPSPRSYHNERSNPRCLTVSVNSKASIWHEQGLCILIMPSLGEIAVSWQGV